MEKQNDPVKRFFLEYLSNLNISSDSLKNYRSDLNHFISWLTLSISTPEAGQTNLSSILPSLTTSLFSKYKAYLIASGTPIKTLNRRLSTLRRLTDFLLKNKYIDRNLMEEVTNINLLTKKISPSPGFLDDFINYLTSSKTAYNTIKCYRSDIKNFINWYGSTDLGSVTPEIIQTYLVSGTNNNDYTVMKRRLASLNKLLAWAKNNGYINEYSEVKHPINSNLSFSPKPQLHIKEVYKLNSQSVFSPYTALFLGIVFTLGFFTLISLFQLTQKPTRTVLETYNVKVLPEYLDQDNVTNYPEFVSSGDMLKNGINVTLSLEDAARILNRYPLISQVPNVSGGSTTSYSLPKLPSKYYTVVPLSKYNLDLNQTISKSVLSWESEDMKGNTGNAVIFAGQQEVLIKNVNVNKSSYIYITPTSDTENKVLFIKRKGIGEFSVGLNSSSSLDISFDWWVDSESLQLDT